MSSLTKRNTLLRKDTRMAIMYDPTLTTTPITYSFDTEAISVTMTEDDLIPEPTIETVVDENGVTRPVQSSRIQFPTRPGQTYDYIELSSAAEPRVERRWFRYRSGSTELDFLWYGDCLYCNSGVWGLADKSTSGLLARSQSLVVINRDGVEYRFCGNCAQREDRIEAGIASKPGQFTGPYEWPDAVIKQIISSPDFERKRILGTVVPVVPRKGALVREKATGRLMNFAGFVDGKVTVNGQYGPFDLDEVEALVPSHPGISYPRATGMPSSAHPGVVVAITSWRGKEPMVQMESGRTMEWSSQHIAALAPVLDPSTETLEAKVERLEAERARLEHGMHARMVAEGVARSWCSEFDQILDITGLPPRQQRNVVTGTMTFTHMISGDVDDAVLDGIKRNWARVIPASAVRVVTVEKMPDERSPLITPA